MTSERRFFYTTWAVLWALLAMILSAVVSARLHVASAFLDAESWFAMFPVAWTGAILITRYREPLRCFWQSPRGTCLVAILLFGSQGYMAWQRGDVLNRIVACIFGLMFAMLVIGICYEVVKSLRVRLARP